MGPWRRRGLSEWRCRAESRGRAQISGYEIDAYDPSVGPPDGTGYTLLSSSPFNTYQHRVFTQNSSIYRSLAGNWVWASGSMDWSWGLSPGGSKNGNKNNVRPCLQVMTRNIFNRMIEDAPGGRLYPKALDPAARYCR
jgi:hypothetical protein